MNNLASFFYLYTYSGNWQEIHQFKKLTNLRWKFILKNMEKFLENFDEIGDFWENFDKLHIFYWKTPEKPGNDFW